MTLQCSVRIFFRGVLSPSDNSSFCDLLSFQRSTEEGARGGGGAGGGGGGGTADSVCISAIGSIDSSRLCL